MIILSKYQIIITYLYFAIKKNIEIFFIYYLNFEIIFYLLFSVHL